MLCLAPAQQLQLERAQSRKKLEVQLQTLAHEKAELESRNTLLETAVALRSYQDPALDAQANILSLSYYYY